MLTRWRAVRMGHRAPGSADRGMTLVELVVGMTLLGIVGAIAVNFFVGGARQTDRVAEESLNSADTRGAVERISSLLQLADTPTGRPGFVTGRFEVLTATRVVFYSNLTSTSRNGTAPRTPPSRIDISIINGALVEKTYSPKTNYTTYPNPYDYTTNYGSTPTTTLTLLRAIANQDVTPAVPVFTYCTAATEPATTCTPATNANNVAAVGVELIVPGKTGTTSQRVRSLVAITGAVS